jgi:hypothetical protein
MKNPQFLFMQQSCFFGKKYFHGGNDSRSSRRGKSTHGAFFVRKTAGSPPGS